jgi:phosphate-selective porin OprO/OprP
LIPDFRQGKTTLQEAWVDAHPFSAVRLLAGKFKAPFGLERLQSDKDLLFIQRGLTNNLVPNRDIGLEFHGGLLDNSLTYQFALTNGVLNNTAAVDADTNYGKDGVFRLFSLPFKDTDIAMARGLGVGVAGSYGDSRGVLSKYTTVGQSTFFTYAQTVSAAGRRYRYSPQAYYYYGPVGLLADFVDDTQSVVNHSFIKRTTGKGRKKKTVRIPYQQLETFASHAWQIQAGYLLTGEDEGYYGVKPAHPFSPTERGWGAWELKARVGGLGVDSDAFHAGFASSKLSAVTATEYGFGINWYLNQNVKLELEYLETFFHKGGIHSGHLSDRPEEGAFLSQVQIAF